MQQDQTVDLTSHENSRPGKRRKKTAPQYVDLTADSPDVAGPGPSSRAAAAAASTWNHSRLDIPLAATRSATAGQQRQPAQQATRGAPPAAEQEVVDDFLVAKKLQEDEDRRAAAAVQADSRLRRRFDELEAAEAAAEAQQAAEAAGSRWGSLGFLDSLFGGSGAHRRGASGTAAAAAAAAATGGPPGGQGQRLGGRGPRSQRSRRGPAGEGEYASAMMGHLVPPPFYHGRGRRGGGYAGEVQQMMMGLSSGLPANLVLSGRDFTDADYEQLLALDAGVKKRTAPRERVSQLETMRVPLASSVPMGAGRGSGSDSPAVTLDTCPICLEDARPGDKIKRLACGHSYHSTCIDRWLLQERNSCPICQREAV
ncbi:hypothetical protein D9Q98_001734 [Chlorella vulgaris]|uniref:RING-type domain-containing protein n=1 Tax=Chlorella vulgaris TaxID=3077 RepID=A0A9D4Z0J6_CHLVU|nr:hypothetical protein D9Q98_001734 [Chlorella vulgaris]